MHPSAPAHHACLTTGPQARTVKQARACPQSGPRRTVTDAARPPGHRSLTIYRDASQPGNPGIPLIMKNQQARGWPQVKRRQPA